MRGNVGDAKCLTKICSLLHGYQGIIIVLKMEMPVRSRLLRGGKEDSFYYMQVALCDLALLENKFFLFVVTGRKTFSLNVIISHCHGHISSLLFVTCAI